MAIITQPYFTYENGEPNERKIYVDTRLVKQDIIRSGINGWTTTMRRIFTPHDPKTTKQTAVRAVMVFCRNQTSKTKYDDNVSRWMSLNAPTITWPGSTAPSTIALSDVTATASNKAIFVTFTPSNAENLSGVVILRDPAEIVTPDPLQAIIFYPTKTAASINYLDSPLRPGTYHYRAAAFELDGKLGPFSPDVSATVT